MGDFVPWDCVLGDFDPNPLTTSERREVSRDDVILSILAMENASSVGEFSGENGGFLSVLHLLW